MTTATTDTPDGERLARVETRLESLERQVGQVRGDILDVRAEVRDVRAEVREVRANSDEQRARADRQFMWLLGIIITMWVSQVAMWFTLMLTVLNKLGS